MGDKMDWKKVPNLPGVRCREHPTRKGPSGRPDVYYVLRHYVDGKRYEEALGWASAGWTVKKVAAVMAQLKEAQRTGGGPQTLAAIRAQNQAAREEQAARERLESAEMLTLGNFFREHYLPTAKKKKASWYGDQNRFNCRINAALGDVPLRGLTREMIQAFLNGLVKAGLAPATVGQYRALIRRLCNVARQTSQEGIPLLEKSPADGLEVPKIFNSRDRFFSYEEADRLIEAAASRRSPDLHDAIILSLNTGLRMGELMRLAWADVDLRHEILTVREADKRKPGGKVPLNQDVVDVFEARLKRRKEDAELVFSPLWGDKRENLSHAFAKLVDELGLNDGVVDRRLRLVFHSLRHTFASWLALSGIDILKIKELMRHKTLAMTLRYAHLIPDATRAAVHQLRPDKLLKAKDE